MTHARGAGAAAVVGDALIVVGGIAGSDHVRTPEIFDGVRAELQARGLLTQAGLFRRLTAELAGRSHPPFDFAVVDETQDLSVAQLRFLAALARYFLFALPPILPEKPPVDNWQTSAWTSRSPGIGRLAGVDADDEHFD